MKIDIALTVVNLVRAGAAGGLALIAVGAVNVSAYGASVKLAPHRAVYDMTLSHTATGAGVVELTGRMVYELTGDACKGYTQNMRFVTRSTDNKGGQSTMDLRSKSWEDGAGRTFRFDTNQFRNETLEEAAVGSAQRMADGKRISVHVAKPKLRRFEVGNNVLFPVQHSVELLQAAMRGKLVFTSDVYDGSENGTKVYATTAIVGAAKPRDFNATLERAENAGALDGLVAWPVSLSYFEKSSGRVDALPSYEIGFVFFENGVSRSLLIDYGHLAIRGRLTKLEMLKAERCSR